MLEDVRSTQLRVVVCSLRASGDILEPTAADWARIARAIEVRRWPNRVETPRVQIVVPRVRRWNRIGDMRAENIRKDAEDVLVDLIERGWVSICFQDV